jgi:hypothetical protein
MYCGSPLLGQYGGIYMRYIPFGYRLFGEVLGYGVRLRTRRCRVRFPVMAFPCIPFTLSEIFSRPVNGTTTIWEDNQSRIAYSQNALVSEKTKHIDMKYHFVKDHVQLNTIRLRYLPTGDMVADMLTKPLHGFALVKHKSAILGTSGPMKRYTS